MKAATKTNEDGSEQLMFGQVILKEKPAWKKNHNRTWKFTLEHLRVYEIETVIRARHGSVIPDPTGTDDLETCLAYLEAVALTPDTHDLDQWSRKWAPWATPDMLTSIHDRTLGRRWMLKADDVANLLHVSMAERLSLGLKTIGACDRTADQRKAEAKEAKRARDRERQREKRRADGRRERKAAEATTITTLQPWRTQGISRATWYRRNRETIASPIANLGTGDTPVSNVSPLSKSSPSKREETCAPTMTPVEEKAA